MTQNLCKDEKFKPYLALKASAGSGKTFALSVRYITLLLTGASPSSIIALTFTKKAASEMSERIITTFLNLEQKSAELGEIGKILGLSCDEILAKRDKVKDEFLSSNLKIMTFDSFFGMILRGFSLNLGLSPDYEIKNLDESVFRLKFIDEIAKSTAILKSLSYYILEFSTGENDFFKTLNLMYENFDEISFAKSTKFPNDSKILALCNALKSEIQKNEKSSKNALKAFDVTDVNELLSKDFIARDTLNYATFSKIYNDSFDDKFNEIKKELKSYLKDLEAYKLSELFEFLKLYKKVKREINRSKNELSFSDVTKLTSVLMSDKDNKDVLYFRLDSKFTHMLIDEFQDTNVTQYAVIKPLIEEIVAGEGQKGVGSFFYVGDVKQSIYRFRGGKKELFDKPTDDFSQIESLPLNTNYRSANGLVEFVNKTFKDNEFIEYEKQFSSNNDDGFVKVFSSDDIILSVANETKWLISKGVAPSDITVLCWKNDDIRHICETLKAQGINASDEGAMMLKNSHIVFALINYAKFCLFSDRIYMKNVSSFLGHEPPKVELNLAKTPCECLKYLAKMAKISNQNLDLLKLFEISSGWNDFISFIFDFENDESTIASAGVDGVRVMTVHKSKGLEFDHVILCDKISRDKPDTGKFIYEYDIKSGWKIMLKAKNREYLDDTYAKLYEKRKRLDKEEELNKLYVAMTRAKNSLIIVKKDAPNGKDPSYFSSYVSNKKDVCYLDLAEFESGNLKVQINPNKPKKRLKKIELVNISKDNSTSVKSDEGQNLNAIYFGLALHYLLEMTADFTCEALNYQKSALINKFSKFLSIDELDDVLNRALNLVKNDKFKAITSKAELKKEQMISFNGEIRQFDLLCFKDNEITILDYKSSDFADKIYKIQMQNYKNILKEIYPNLSIKAVIFYVLKNEIRAIEV